jgi:hypothetical protein
MAGNQMKSLVGEPVVFWSQKEGCDMDKIQIQVESLRRRVRLQNLVGVGALVILLFAVGGADTVARTLVESDAWTIRTKNAGGTLTDRLVVTTDVDLARIKVANANIELAQQSATPDTTTPGALWYDSTAGRLKYRNATDWVDTSSGGAQVVIVKPSDESRTSTTVLQSDNNLQFSMGANETWQFEVVLFVVVANASPDIKLALNGPGTPASLRAHFQGWQREGNEPNPDGAIVTSYGSAWQTDWGGNVDTKVVIQGSITNGSTAGSLVIQWAQRASNSTPTYVMKGSTLIARKVS